MAATPGRARCRGSRPAIVLSSACRAASTHQSSSCSGRLCGRDPNPRVIQAIRSGAVGKIAVSFRGIVGRRRTEESSSTGRSFTRGDRQGFLRSGHRSAARRCRTVTRSAGGIDSPCTARQRALPANRHTIDGRATDTNNPARDVVVHATRRSPRE